MLEYERKQAPHERGIIRSCLAAGKPYPKAIANAPQLEDGNEFFCTAFLVLGTCRAYELGPIPYTVIRDYGRDLELDEEQLERLIGVITQTDQWLRGEIGAEIQKDRDKANG